MAVVAFPDNPFLGQVHDQWTWNGSLWEFSPQDAATSYTFVQATMPTPAAEGQTWFCTRTGTMAGTSWVAVDNGSGGLVWVQSSGAEGPQGKTGAPGTPGGTITTAAQLPFVPAGTIAASNVQAAIQEVATDNSPAWTALTFSGVWVNYSAPYGPCAYRKVNDEVQMRGLCQGGAAVSAITALPVGYRPVQEYIAIVSAGAGVGEIRVNTAGTVTYQVLLSGTYSGWLSLSDVRFSTI